MTNKDEMEFSISKDLYHVFASRPSTSIPWDIRLKYTGPIAENKEFRRSVIDIFSNFEKELKDLSKKYEELKDLSKKYEEMNDKSL